MVKKLVLLVEDDPKVEERIVEILQSEFKVVTAKGIESAQDFLRKKNPEVILIDFDLKAEDGLHVFREIHPLKPEIAVIMLSGSGNIPLAVAATKAGVAEFLRKPLNAEQLKEAVSRNLPQPAAKMVLPKDLWWLEGESAAVRKMLSAIQEICKKPQDIILSAEKGIDKSQVAAIIHVNGPKKDRKLSILDLAAFRGEAVEAHFWTLLKKLLAFPDASSVSDEKDLSGTLYLENFESINREFKKELLGFIEKRSGKIDRSIRVVISADSHPKDFARIEIPPLRQRKEDLPHLLAVVLHFYSGEHNKSIKHISSELLEFLMAYNYPGNYQELERLIQAAVFSASADRLELKDLPFNFEAFLGAMLKKDSLNLEGAKQVFEKELYKVLLEKANGNNLQVARFLDMPKTAFVQRLEELQYLIN